jgi:uncharacterized SAM-binding protein YcdF (DUF218 family)
MEFSELDIFVNYLEQGNYFAESFGDSNTAELVLALSFGDSGGVNRKLAGVLDEVKVESEIKYVQWEIAELIKNSSGVNVIRLDENENYMTTSEVIQKLVEKYGDAGKVFLVAQAWHAPRCKYLCEKKGLGVIGGKFVDEFLPDDPQLWVRDVLSWVLKESIAMKMDKA